MALLAEHLLKPLPADKQIETGPFLEAVSHLPPFFDCLGSPVFTPIKADISGNITKIKAVYDTNPAKFQTLQNILEVEKEMYGAEWPKVGATLALMWLKRASATGSGTRITPTSSASTPPRPTRWRSRSTTAGLCRRSSSAVRGTLQVRLPESTLEGAECDRGGVPGEGPPLPGQLHGHHRRHLRDVHQDER
ncbi:glycolipid transfer protein isoform X2 [Ursus americanus]|uniref:glycolipid transfer protein isoform X2 n=1 Tax=Ursus americanus TaxID=9643 RepID=UPI001E67DBC7|nr:glycolipid transfer protein isoform X2 [Ursus americanus]